jgi:uncharacterized protein with HEPN domain
MSKRNDAELIQDISESINRIISYTEKINYEQFKTDLKTQDAVLRNIEIMGEATKLLSEKIKLRHSDIPWKNIAGTRDKLIHDYFGVNIDIVWDIVSNDIPNLRLKLQDIGNFSDLI